MRPQGLRDLMQQIREKRRQALDRFNLSSVIDDIARQLEEILDLERDTLDERLAEAGPPPDGGGADGPERSAGERDARGEGNDAADGDASPERPRRADAPGGSGQRPGQSTGGQAGAGEAPETKQFSAMLRRIVQRKQQFLDGLPDDPAAQFRELRGYEFMNPEAQRRFQALLDSLKQAMMDTFFKDLSQMIQNMSPEYMERMQAMVGELNEMMRQRMAGQQPDFDGFMDRYGDLFGDQPPQSLDELVQQMQQQAAMMQNLLDSLPGEMRAQLQDLLADKVGDPDLQAELHELAANLESLYPVRELRNQYPFRGDEEIDLQAAMRLMDEMQGMDELERQLTRSQHAGDLDAIDPERLEELLGEEARETLDQLKQFLEILEDAGYIRRKGRGWELTPRGMRKIGQKALGEIYATLKKETFGKHQAPELGRSGEKADDTKPYEFGDAFHLHLERTIMNSMQRRGQACRSRSAPTISRSTAPKRSPKPRPC